MTNLNWDRCGYSWGCGSLLWDNWGQVQRVDWISLLSYRLFTGFFHPPECNSCLSLSLSRSLLITFPNSLCTHNSIALSLAHFEASNMSPGLGLSWAGYARWLAGTIKVNLSICRLICTSPHSSTRYKRRKHSSSLVSICPLATPAQTSAIPYIIRPLYLVASLAGALHRMPRLLLLLVLVAQLLDGAHCAEHHLGRQLCVMRRGALLAARIRAGIPIQARIRVGVRARIGHVIVVQIATAAALMRHLHARVCVCDCVCSMWTWTRMWGDYYSLRQWSKSEQFRKLCRSARRVWVVLGERARARNKT